MEQTAAVERSDLIKTLQKEQETEGYISDEAIERIATEFDVPPVEVEGVVSFYTQFKRIPPGKYHIMVCDGTACHIIGAPLILTWLADALGIRDGETDENGLFSMESVACLGCCSLAPVISINGKVYGKLDRKKLLKTIREYKKAEDSNGRSNQTQSKSTAENTGAAE